MQLLTSFPPRPIKSEDDFEKTQAVIYDLLDKKELTEEEKDYLNLLGMVIYEYEEQQEDLVPDIYGVELLKVLVDQVGLKQKDLVPIFKTESIVSDVLKGKRKLTVEHIQKLGSFFNVSPAVFFPIDTLDRDYLDVA
jgi:HTH-type transcriptional regulator / antitoxin HigA